MNYYINLSRPNHLHLFKSQKKGILLSNQEDTELDQEVDEKVDFPKRYKVFLHNDDFTTMDFVIYILMKYFSKTEPEAHQVMLDVHNNGAGLCGIYTYEIAETKVAKVTEEAKKREFPLLCSCEPEE